MKNLYRPATIIALALLVATVALIGVAPEAMAAVSVSVAHVDHSPWMSHLGHASIALLTLRKDLRDLTDQERRKIAELTDDCDDAKARKIEGEHADIVAKIDDVKRKIADEEKREREASEANDRSIVEGEEAQRRAATDLAVTAERDRISQIRALGDQHKMPAELVDAAIKDGKKIEEFRASVLDKLVEGQKGKGPESGAHNRGVETGGQDETETRREAMVEYIMARANAPGAMMTERAAAMYRGMNAVALVAETLGWRGEKTRGLLPDEIAQRGLMTTSDFPSILAAVANKTLRQAYQAAPRTFVPWTRAIILSDFKTYNIVRRGETPQLALINEKGEYKRGSISESKETIALKSYGVVVGMTRQMIINDDLGAFASIPSDFGQSAASLESDLVYGALLANGALATDSVAIFHANHGNLAASGTALDIAPLSTMRAKMAKQTGLDGKTVLNVMARYLLVPPELESRAEQLLASFTAAKNADVVPESIRSLTPISEARLSVGVNNAGAGVTQSGSATAYYLMSDMVDTIVTASLNGQTGPYTESRIGFDVDGVEIKCRHDFGASAADFRGMQKDPGA